MANEDKDGSKYFEDLFSAFNENFEVVQSTFNSKEDYSVILRTRLPTGKSPQHSCDLWKEEFCKLTNTCWTVRDTFPHAKDYVYRKKYECQHSKQNKSKDQSKHEHYTKYRNKNCSASIDIKIQKETSSTKKKHKHVSEGRTATIKIHFNHTHLIENAEAYSYLRMTTETKEVLLGLFEDGMTPAVAKLTLERNLEDQCEDVYELHKILSNAQVNPTNAQIQGLYNNYRTGEFGGRNQKSVLEKLKEKQKIYAEKGVEILIEEDPLCVAIVTPLMRRAHTLTDISDICFIDSSGSCDQTSTVVTFLYGSTKVGGIPLGVVLHTGQSEQNYTCAFNLLKTLLGPDSFNKQGYPTVIMTDDSKAEKNAIKNVYPYSTQLLCAFHVLQALWRWEWDSHNKIDKDDRPLLMRLVRNMMFAPTEIDFELELTSLSVNSVVVKYPNFLAHINKLLERKTEWCFCYRQNLCIRGHNTNNTVEASIRIFKDCVLQRCKSYNMVSLIHFVGSNLEMYHYRRLLAFAGSRKSQPQLLYNMLKKKAENLSVKKVAESEYHVESSTDSNLVYQVFTDVEQCTCYEGSGGKFCKHLCAVQLKCNIEMNHCPLLSTADKKSLAILALGVENVDIAFYESMDSTQLQSNVSDQFDNADIQNDGIEDINLEPVVDTNDTSSDMSDSDVSELESHFQRLLTLASKSSKSNVKKLCSKLEKIDTQSQFDEFCQNRSLVSCKSSRIKVQPTAIARRKKRPGLSSGALRIQAGRPANEEYFPAAKKKKRNLGLSVTENRANAKSHGKNH